MKSETLAKRLDAFQKSNYIPYEEWNKEKYFVIIGVCDKGYKLTGFIKTFELDFKTGAVKYTLTTTPQNAFLFGSDISTMLYHNLRNLIKRNTNHYPIRLGTPKNN